MNNNSLMEGITLPLIADREGISNTRSSEHSTENGLNELPKKMVHSQQEVSDFDLSINVDLVKNYSYIENPTIMAVNELNQCIKERVMIWDTGNNTNNKITFNLPNTFTPESELNAFSTEIRPNLITFSQENDLFPIMEDQNKQENFDNQQVETQGIYQNEYDNLNSEQISQIWNTGRFTRIYSKKVIDSIRHNPQRPWLENARMWYSGLNVFNGMRSIAGIPGHLIILIFGIEFYTIDSAKFDEAVLQLLSSRIEWKIFAGNETRYGDILFLKHAQENPQSYDLSEFEINYNDEMLRLTQKVHDGSLILDLSNTSDKSCVKRILQDLIYERVIEQVSNHLRSKNYSENLIQSFESTYRSQIAMDRLKRFQTLMNVSDKQLSNKELANIAFEFLKTFKCEKHSALLELIINELRQGVSEEELNAIKQELRQTGVNATFRIVRYPPKVQQIQVGNSVVYSEKPFQTFQVTSSYFGWKLVYFLKATYCQVLSDINLYYFLAFNPFMGLKAVYYVQPFDQLFSCNPEDGSLEPKVAKIFITISEHYRLIREKANKSIEDFENEPDQGLLGKSIARVCNRLENWVFRHFLYGFLFVNIILRIICMMCSVILIIWIPASIVLSPLYVGFRLAVTLILADITMPEAETDWEFPFLFPILDLFIWRFVIRGAVQIGLAIALFAFHIAFGMFLVLLSLVIYLLRRCMDCVMFIFIYSCGRIPGGNSYLAYRTGCQEVDEALYNRNQSEEAAAIVEVEAVGMIQTTEMKSQFTLVQVKRLIDAEFDKRILNEYRREIIAKIREPVESNDRVMQEILQGLPVNFESNKVSIQYNLAANKMIASLDEQISKHSQRLPFRTLDQSQVFAYRLDELVSLKRSVIEYLEDKYSSNPLFKRIIWSEFDVEVNNYELLTLKLFNTIFFGDRVGSPTSVLEELRHIEVSAASAKKNINNQIDCFLKAKFNIQSDLQQPFEFFSYQQFITKVLAAHTDSTNRVINIKKNQFDNFDELLLLNAVPRYMSGEHLL